MTALTGTGALVRLGLRRDRVILPVWILGLAVMVNSTASALVGLYSRASQREELAATMAANKALVALLGPLTHPDSLGATLAWRGQTFYASAVGLMALFTVVRHTRREEESGRLELIGSAVVGRFAALAAALMLGVGASVAVGLFSAALLAAQDFPVAGSLALGAALAVPGIVFAVFAGLAGLAGLAAVTAQVTQTARSASALAGGGLAIAFGLRSAADVDPGALAWVGVVFAFVIGELGSLFNFPRWLVDVSPFTHVSAVLSQPYSSGPLVVLVGIAAALVAVGAGAFCRRDLVP